MSSITPRQLALSLFTALAAPLVMLCSATAWPAVLLGLALAGLSVQALQCALAEGKRLSSGLSWIYILWCVLLMARTVAMCESCFQGKTLFVPVVLLALAAASVYHGAEVSGRLGAILWPTTALLLGGMLLFAVQDIRWDRLVAEHGAVEDWMPVAAAAATPAVLWPLVGATTQGRGIRAGYWAAAALGLFASVLACGVLGRLRPYLTQPLYDIARGVRALGIAERLEALLSVGLCVGFFQTLSLLCASGSVLLHGYTEQQDRWHGVLLAASALALYRPVAELPSEFWVVLTVVLGLGVPIALIFAPTEKEEKRRKKGLTKGGGSDMISKLR